MSIGVELMKRNAKNIILGLMNCLQNVIIKYSDLWAVEVIAAILLLKATLAVKDV